MTTKAEQTIFLLLTENTGTHFLDSGGSGNRNWQRNQGLTIEALEAAPSATLEVLHSDGWGYDLTPTVSLWHFLTQQLDLCELCEEFNSLKVEDWEGDTCGTSKAGTAWLAKHDFELGESYNSCNWESNLSQVIQWTTLERDGAHYVLLQVHGGADVRGGYTDAKLFEVSGYDPEYFGHREDSSFGVDGEPDLSLTWSGEWINAEGGSAVDEDLDAFAKAAFKGREDDGDITLAGDLYIE